MIDQNTEALLTSLKQLSQKGPIVLPNKNSNAIGKILQQELGIEHNSKQKNSLHGYTISSKTKSRPNLFASVPNWSKSIYKSSTQLVNEVGKEDVERNYQKSLFCTVSAKGPNSFGLYLRYNKDLNTIEEWLERGSHNECILIWDIETLKKKLASIGRRALITAIPVDLSGKKGVHFRYAELVDEPSLEQFIGLIQSGAITLDHLISMKIGARTAREQGPMFKINPESVELLHGPIKKIDLMNISV